MSKCNSECKLANKKTGLSWLFALVVAILPKCPFCIMAYSGAMTLCSGTTIYPQLGNYSLYIIITLSLIVCLGIAFNYRGKRTIIALLISLFGILSLVASQSFWMGQTAYYIGVVLLFFGIWYNGSFFYFFKRLRKVFGS